MNMVNELRSLAYAYQKEGKYDLSITLLEGLVALGSNEAYDYQSLGALYLETGRPKQSLTWLKQAIQLERRHLPTHLNRAKAFLACGRIEVGLKLARALSGARNQRIADRAEALLMAYSDREESKESPKPTSPYPHPLEGNDSLKRKSA